MVVADTIHPLTQDRALSNSRGRLECTVRSPRSGWRIASVASNIVVLDERRQPLSRLEMVIERKQFTYR
jgi:hypothetical protein